MEIRIANFLSIKKAEFGIKKGITVIAGKNGCGKAQLLLAIAQTNTNEDILSQYGFVHKDETKSALTEIIPAPGLVLYRPAIRYIADDNRENEFAYTKPLKAFINSKEKKGYVNHIQERFKNLYAILANFYNAGTNYHADSEIKERWELLSNKFFEVFQKRLYGEINIFNGTKIGIQLKSGRISSLNTLSTGELEFLSLLSDLILEYEFPNSAFVNVPESFNERKIKGDKRSLPKSNMILVDELDAHFHPDLQRKIIEIITPLCREKYVILTTHSPAVMLSVPSENLFYMKSSIEAKAENQLTKVSDDILLYDSLAEMYQGFVGDIKLAQHLDDAGNKIILRYAKECLTPHLFA